jgi:hypothetical protein
MARPQEDHSIYDYIAAFTVIIGLAALVWPALILLERIKRRG